MSSFEDHLTSLTSPTSPTRNLPGVILLCHNATGQRIYTQTTGTTSLIPNLSRPLTEKSIMWIASCTKLLTSLSVLQLVEKGTVGLDDSIDAVLPELAAVKVLHGWGEDGEPVLKDRVAKLTLRHLVTHTSGLAYDFLSGDVLKYWKWKGVEAQERMGKIVEGFSAPLQFEPGSKWGYSPGLDWAGLLVARVSGEPSLGSYFKKHIFDPLGIKVAAFRKSELGLDEDEMKERWAWMTARESGGGMASSDAFRDFEPRDDTGGGGLLTCPEEYIKVLVSLLCNDGKLLKKETVDTMVYEPQLVDGKISKAAGKVLLQVTATMEGSRMLTGGYPLPEPEHGNGVGGEWEYQHGLLGLLTRKYGEKEWVLNWGGLPNLFWWVDPKNGLCGHYAGQIIPPGDPTSLDLEVEWREEMLKRFGRGESAKSNL